MTYPGQCGRLCAWMLMICVVSTLAACSDEETEAPATVDDTGGADTAEPPDTAGSTDTGCADGELGCACLGDGTCTGELVCDEGLCAEPAVCPDGADGCACYPNGTCDSGLICVAGECAPDEGTCPPGTSGCPCADGDICEAGLSCQEGSCVVPMVAEGVVVSNAVVRACGFVVDAGDTAATFDAQVIGRSRRSGPRTAVAFTAASDSPLTGTVLTLTGSDGLELQAIECFDRHGVVVAEPGLTLN